DRAAVSDREGRVFPDRLVPLSADVDPLVLADGPRALARDGDVLVLAHALAAVARNGDRLVATDGLGAVLANVDRLVVPHRLVAVVADADLLVVAHGLGPVVLDHDLLVLLRMDVQQLLALLVLHADLVEVVRAAALAAARLDPALRLVRRQLVRWDLLRVVDAARDDRAVRVALQEVDDDLLPDARDVDHAPPLARPRARHPYPARALLVLLAVPVPVEVELDPPVLVRPDLLARLPHDHGGLRPAHHRLLRLPRRAVGHRVRDRQELRPVLERLGLLAGMVLARARRVLHAQQHERVVLERALQLVLDGEAVPAAQRPARTLAPHHVAQRLLGLELEPRVAVARILRRVQPRVVVDLLLAVARQRARQAERRLEVVVVLERDLAHVHRVLLHQRREHVLAVGQDRLLGQQPDAARARAFRERVVAVRQRQAVLRVRVLEEVEDALLLHEP